LVLRSGSSKDAEIVRLPIAPDGRPPVSGLTAVLGLTDGIASERVA
jgi:hypothetical protein